MSIESNLLNFNEILLRVKALLETNSDKEVATAIGMKPNTFNMRKKNNSVPLIEFVMLADSKKVNMNWLIYGEGPIYKDEKKDPSDSYAISKSDKTIVIEHSDLVGEFKDKKRAFKMNHNLLKIEKSNEQAFRDIDNYIEGVASGLKYSSPPEGKSKELPPSKALIPEENQRNQKKIG